MEHSGVVLRTDDRTVWVRIEARSACGGCKAREACGLAEAAEKVVAVRTPDAGRFAAGDAVRVGVRRRVGGLAVALAYVGALVVLLVVLFAGVRLAGWSQGVAAGASLCGVGLYYGLLWLLRGRIERTIKFTIKTD